MARTAPQYDRPSLGKTVRLTNVSALGTCKSFRPPQEFKVSCACRIIGEYPLKFRKRRRETTGIHGRNLASECLIGNKPDRQGYNETVEAARLTLGAPSLVIDVQKQKVTASGKPFHLAPAQLAMLLVFARRILNGEKALCAPSKEYKDSLEVAWAERYLAELHRIVGLLGDTDTAERTLANGMDGDYFSTTLPRLHKAFEKNMGKTAIHYRIGDGGCRPRQYSLSLWPNQITLIE